MMSASSLLLHVWPGRWGLPSIDASCIEATLYLQITVPNYYYIVETVDPDASPCGQLPFLTHGPVTVSSVPSIVSYVSGLDLSTLDPENADYNEGPSKFNLDVGLSTLQVSQATAWKAYVEAQLGDLVTHSFFVLAPNYREFTYGLLASMLSVPQRYYVPDRIKEGHRPRLEATGLWQIASEPEVQDASGTNRHSVDNEQQIKRAFGQVKLLEKAQPVFDILSRLHKKAFVFGEKPSSLDLSLASRILLLTQAPLPNPALKERLDMSYPNLVAHASRTYAFAFPTGSQPRILAPPRVYPFGVLKSTLSHLYRGMATAQESEEEKRFRRYRWGWIGLALFGVVGYFVSNGVTVIREIEHKGEEVEEEEEPTIQVDSDQDDE